MPIPAYRNNIILVCEFLLEEGHVSPDRPHNLEQIPKLYLDDRSREWLLEEGVIRECEGGFHLRESSYRRWRKSGDSLFGF